MQVSAPAMLECSAVMWYSATSLDWYEAPRLANTTYLFMLWHSL